jgi:hypothetical protein
MRGNYSLVTDLLINLSQPPQLGGFSLCLYRNLLKNKYGYDHYSDIYT